jgi:translation elongation factor EF-G
MFGRQILDGSKCFLPILGIKRFAVSLWKTFKADFGELEERISAARGEVSEEIKLASEQAAHEFCQLQMIETRENQVFRLLQSAETEENRRFRSQQISALAETQDRLVQKCIREEGNIPQDTLEIIL